MHDKEIKKNACPISIASKYGNPKTIKQKTTFHLQDITSSRKEQRYLLEFVIDTTFDHGWSFNSDNISARMGKSVVACA